MKDSVIRARVPAALKARAAEVLAACGLEPSEAIRLFLQQVVVHEGLPFAVRAAAAEPSMADLQHLKRASQARDRRQASLGQGSEGEFLLVRPADLRRARIRWPKAKLD